MPERSIDYAEEQAQRRKTISMAQWAEKLDAFLQFNEHELLTHAGKIQVAVAQKLAQGRYDTFNDRRRKTEALAADVEDIREIEQLAEKLAEENYR